MNYDELYITPVITEGIYAYIFVNETNPNEFNSKVTRYNGSFDYRATQYNNIHSGLQKECNPDNKNIYIVTYDEYKNLDYGKCKARKYYKNFILIY